MVKQIIENLKSHLEKNKEYLVREFSLIRTGRANPALVENILVDYYGVKTPLKQIANISVPEPKQINIQSWDKGAIEQIILAITKSQLGLSAVLDRDIIRINIPQLTEERRKELVKLINAKLEEARIGVRKMRDEALKEIQNLESRKEISEDEKFKSKDDIQKIIDSHNDILVKLLSEKEKEVMTV